MSCDGSREATLHKVGRYYQAQGKRIERGCAQDEFQKNQDEWEAHLAGHKHGPESERVSKSEANA